MMTSPTNKSFNKNHLNILVVDDVAVNRKILSNQLKDILSAVAVTHAHDGLQAIAAVEEKAEAKQEFALVFMDIHMPHLDGREATKRIKQKCPHAIIIACTTITTQQEDFLVEGSGFNGYLFKPFSKATLSAHLKQFLPKAPLQNPVVANAAANLNLPTACAAHSAVIEEKRTVPVLAKRSTALITAACTDIGFFAPLSPRSTSDATGTLDLKNITSHPLDSMVSNIAETPTSTPIASARTCIYQPLAWLMNPRTFLQHTQPPQKCQSPGVSSSPLVRATIS